MNYGILLVCFLLVLTSCTTTLPPSAPAEQGIASEIESLDDLQSGGPPPDGIPSIDNPKYVSVAEADNWIEDNELVLALKHNDIIRVYPLQIMTWHEIVNDNVGGEPVLITYCPLCGSGIAYERTLNGDVVEFGTSGRLYNSNLVMYDRATTSYWTQIDGVAILGPQKGNVLTPINIDTVTWGEWKYAHPESEILSRDTGYQRDYGANPYSNYFADDFLMFPVNAESTKLANKDVVYGITVNGVDKAYPDSHLETTITDTVGGVEIKITRENDGSISIVDNEGNEIIKERDFWFAWFAFHPETLLYEG